MWLCSTAHCTLCMFCVRWTIRRANLGAACTMAFWFFSSSIDCPFYRHLDSLSAQQSHFFLLSLFLALVFFVFIRFAIRRSCCGRFLVHFIEFALSFELWSLSLSGDALLLLFERVRVYQNTSFFDHKNAHCIDAETNISHTHAHTRTRYISNRQLSGV